MKKTGRTQKVNMKSRPDLYAAYVNKCAEMNISPSACFEIWMDVLVNSDAAMNRFERLFECMVKIESEKKNP